MSIVRGLVLAHVSATALLLLIFLAVVVWQRLAAVLQRDDALVVAYPSDAQRSATPVLSAPAPESQQVSVTATTAGRADAMADPVPQLQNSA